MTVVLLARDFGPGHAGGIATFTGGLARALAALGHSVHVISASADINRVDLEQGAWVHRVLVGEHTLPEEASREGVLPHIWNWSRTAFEETARIARHRPVDVVEAPVWDGQGVAFLMERRWPLVTSLQTTMHFWLDSHVDHRSDPAWMHAVGTPTLRAERFVMAGCDAVRSISAAIRRDIEAAYAMQFDEEQIFVQPLGIEDVPAPPPAMPRAASNAGPEVLFVGRFEMRKGIDVLFEAMPAVLARVPQARFRLVGDASLPGPDGQSWQDAFFATPRGADCADRVQIDGVLDDDALRAAYAGADLFVAPSRFESFGLVFLEAMRAGKPVIGCDAGGMSEIIAHGVNGLLAPPGDAAALADAIVALLSDAPARERMGQAGRKIYQERFTAQAMAQASLPLYRRAQQRHGQRTSLQLEHA